MSIEDLRTIDRASPIESDLCIIGSGPAGWTLAEELRNSRLRMVMVESGGLEPEPQSYALNEVESTGVPLFNGRDRVLGGTSHSWGGRCVAFNHIDYEVRPWAPFSGWPFGSEGVAPYLDDAAKHLGAGPYTPDGRGPNPEGLSKRPAVDPTQLRNLCWEDPTPIDFGQLLRARENPNLRVIVHATATHLNTDASGRRIESVEVADPDNKRSIIRARVAVLCAGGMENPRLLLYSNRVVATGLGNAHDVVGRFLMDHPRDPQMIVRFDTRDAAQIRDLFGPYKLDGIRGRHGFVHGFRLSPELQRDERLLNCAAWPFEILATDDPIEAGKRLIHGPRNQALRDAGHILSQPGLLMHAVHAKVMADQRVRRRIDAIGFLIGSEQAPDRDSRIRLSDRLGRLDLPIPEINWRIGMQERASQATLARAIALEFQRLGLPRAQLADWVQTGRYDEASFVDGCHPSGTTRMASDPRQGVVDADCKVHGVEGLYVAGSSVFPTDGHANPTLMIVALAVRLARHLKVRFSSESDRGDMSVAAGRIGRVRSETPALPPGARIAVTGATGFIGGRLVERLIEHGAIVTCLVRPSADVARLREFGPTIHALDLADPEATRGALGTIDYVFHCAYDPVDVRWNLAALRALIGACRANGCRRLVHLSSFVVYRLPSEGEVNEATDEDVSDSGYAHNKRELEDELLQASREGEFTASILQPTIVYGPFSRPWTNDPADMLRHGSVVLPDAGEGACNAVYVDDVVSAMILASRRPEAAGQRFLISGPDATTWGRFYEAIAQAVGAKPPLYRPAETIYRAGSKTRKLLRLAADPQGVLRRVAQIGPARKLALAALRTLPRSLRGYAEERLFGLATCRRGYVHLPNRGHLGFLQSRATISSQKARRELGYSPQFDFEAGMALTSRYLRERLEPRRNSAKSRVVSP